MARPALTFMHSRRVSDEACFATSLCREPEARAPGELEAQAAAVRNWPRVVKLCRQHRVAGLVLPLVDDLAQSGRVPAGTAYGLRDAAMGDVARTAKLRRALVELLPTIGSIAGGVVVLKGPVLATLLYRDPSLRPYNDLDLLCREPDFDAACAALFGLGYCFAGDPALRPRRHPRETYWERYFFRKRDSVAVELHVDGLKVGLKPREADAVWQRVRALEIDGATALALAPGDQLLQLCVHVHRHGYPCLGWLKDLDLLVRRFDQELDWRRIIEAARAEGVEPFLWHALGYAVKLLATPVPRAVLQALNPGRLARWAFSRVRSEAEVSGLAQLSRSRLRGIDQVNALIMGRKRERVGALILERLSLG